MNHLKKCLFLLILTPLLLACSGSKSVDNKSSVQAKIEQKVTLENVFDKILLVINGETNFDDISVTYENMVKEFSKEYRESFEKDAGELFRDRFPKWRNESVKTLSEVCSDNGASMTNTNIKLQKDDGELKAYSGEFTITCGEQSRFLRFSAFEIKNKFYVSQVVLPNN